MPFRRHDADSLASLQGESRWARWPVQRGPRRAAPASTTSRSSTTRSDSSICKPRSIPRQSGSGRCTVHSRNRPESSAHMSVHTSPHSARCWERRRSRARHLTFSGVTQDPHAFRSTAVAFEDLAVEAYKYQLPHLSSPAYLAAAVSIHSVEARHAAWIRRLAGVLPAATPFDHSLAPDKVDKLVASTHFIVARPRMKADAAPKFTG